MKRLKERTWSTANHYHYERIDRASPDECAGDLPIGSPHTANNIDRKSVELTLSQKVTITGP